MKWLFTILIFIFSGKNWAELPYPPGHPTDLWYPVSNAVSVPQNSFRTSSGQIVCLGYDKYSAIWLPGIMSCGADESGCVCRSATSAAGKETYVFDEFLVLNAFSDLFLSEPENVYPDKRLIFQIEETDYSFCIAEDADTQSAIPGFVIGNGKHCMAAGRAYSNYREFQLVRTGFFEKLFFLFKLTGTLFIGGTIGTMGYAIAIEYAGVILVGDPRKPK